MRLLLTVLITAIIIYSPCLAGDYEVVTVGKGGSARWSPDGRYLSYISGKGLMLYVVDSGYSRSIVHRDSIRRITVFDYQWLGIDTLIFARRGCAEQSIEARQCRTFFTIDVEGKHTILSEEVVGFGSTKTSKLVRMSNGEVGIKRAGSLSIQSIAAKLGRAVVDTAAYYAVSNADWPHWRNWNQQKNKDIWLVKYDGTPFQRVTTNQHYRLIELSPDGKLIVAWVGGPTVLDLNGNVVMRFQGGGGGSWFEDSHRLAVSVEIDDGYDVTGGDIYVIDVLDQTALQITDTPNKIELEPTVSPDMTRIAYRWYASDANYIEIIEIEGGTQ